MTKKIKKRLGIAVVLIFIIGSLFMVQTKTPFDIFLTKKYTKPTQEEQIAYLKKHEQKMTDYIKSQNSKITSVQWDWHSLEVREVQPNAGGFTTGGKYNEMSIEGKINNIEDSGVGLKWHLPDKSYYPPINAMTLWGNVNYGGN